MNIKINEINGTALAEIISGSILINNLQDALDLIANADYQGSRKIIMQQLQFTPDFFDLKTGLAGEILQKFVTYGVKLAIVGDFSKYKSKSLHDFIYESNKQGMISFVGTIEEARKALQKN